MRLQYVVAVDDPRVTITFGKKESRSYYSTSLSWSYTRRKCEVYLSLTYFQFPLNVMVDEYEKMGISFRLIKDRQDRQMEIVLHQCQESLHDE